MAIAANFLKFPQAMALQLPLRLGKPVWNTKRPSTRRGRAFRAHIAAVVKAVGLRVAPVAKVVPQWWKDAKAKARALAKEVKCDCIELDFAAPAKRPNLMRQIAAMGLSAWV
jgi:hypothetical protein